MAYPPLMDNPLAQSILDFFAFFAKGNYMIPLIALSLIFNMNFMSFYLSDLEKGGSVAINLRCIP